MSKREKKETRAFTFEYVSPEGDRITIIRDEERTEADIDIDNIPRNTLDQWQRIVSGALLGETGEEIPPDTIDIYAKSPFRAIRTCPNCGETINWISARYCPTCGTGLS